MLSSILNGKNCRLSLFDVSSLLLTQNTSFLTLPVTKCVAVSPTPRNFLQHWSRVALTFCGLKQDFSSQLETEVSLRQGELKILATRLRGQIGNDKALALNFHRETESSEISKVFIKRKKEYSTCGDTQE